MRATGAGAVPATPNGRYWEEYAGTDGKRYLAFAQISLGATELAKLVEAYTQSTSALGATVVGTFPLIGWRYPKVERGAIITSMQDGPLQTAGITEQYVVLAIDGRDVTDATTFARLATDEYVALSVRGGTLRLKVQTADPAPREFQAAVKAQTVEPPHQGSGKRPGTGSNSGTGGVNVWDKFDRKDDPTQ